MIINKRTPVVWLVGMSVLANAIGSAGCAKVVGPERMPVTALSGVVTEGRRPVGGGWIEFIPVDGTIGTLRSARLNTDGSFQAKGVAVGVNLVRIVSAPIESPAIARFVGSFASPIRRVASLLDRQPLAIDLLDETIQFQASLSARTGDARPAAAR
ncbi:MAG: hypothetical protein ACLQIB_48125 [Isosphaeraceae bacterium]